MRKLLTLKKDYEIKLKSNIIQYKNPKYVYLPLKETEKIVSHPEVKKGERISNYSISPISGKIMGIKYCTTVEHEMVKCLAILNDYKETFFKRSASIKNLEKVSLEKWVIDLKDHQENLIADKILGVPNNAILILNGIEDEPYVANEIFINKEYTQEILETIDILREKIGASFTRIILKDNDRENIEKFESLIGTYTNMELNLIPDYYLIGQDEFLKKYLKIAKDCVIFKPSEIKRMYDIIKRQRFITEHLFTISGNGISNPQMMEAKLGSSVKDIIDQYIKIKKGEEVEYIINGLMTGRKIEIENLIVTKELKSLLIMKKDTLPETECINCGKCVEVCPMSCNPRALLEKNNPKYRQNCIDCGLCSYICPSFINLRKYLKGENHE